MKIFYFTSTGNCLYVAKRIGGELISIPQALKAGNLEFSDEKIGLVFPVYFIRVPQNVEDFLKKAKFKSPYIFAVMTYGMMAGSADTHLQKIAEGCGIKFDYIRTLKMVDNFIPGFDMKKQIETEPEKEIEKHLDTIIDDIRHSKKLMPKPSFLKNLMYALFKKKDAVGPGTARDFLIEDSCVKCGTCATLCPLDNISLRGGKPTFGTRCISCLACTQNCPANAIRVKNEKSRDRFRNGHITLQEIVDANK